MGLGAAMWSVHGPSWVNVDLVVLFRGVHHSFSSTGTGLGRVASKDREGWVAVGRGTRDLLVV